jgi:hypothetical protein
MPGLNHLLEFPLDLPVQRKRLHTCGGFGRAGTGSFFGLHQGIGTPTAVGVQVIHMT